MASYNCWPFFKILVMGSAWASISREQTSLSRLAGAPRQA
jgi:hypothetical protein